MILLGPYLTEKSELEAKQNRYSFLVDSKANKPEIKKEIERRYKVNVVHITSQIVKGKKKAIRTRRKIHYYTLPNLKKVTVTLKKGQKIGILAEE